MSKSKSLIVFSLLVFAIAIVALVGYVPGRAAVNVNDPFGTTVVADNHGFDLSNLDTSVSACTNFFQYADGGWVAKNPVPAAYPDRKSTRLNSIHHIISYPVFSLKKKNL